MQISEELESPAFKLVTIYEDNTARGRAAALHGFLAQGCLNGFEIKKSTWSFASLCHPRLRERATQAAAAADVLVIATGRAAALPEFVQFWMKGVRPNKPDFRPAMVALLTPENEAKPKSENLVYWLRRMAEERGMDFFCKEVVDDAVEPYLPFRSPG